MSDSIKKVSSNMTVILIICLTGLMSQFATDSFIPSLPHIASYFNVAERDIKLTVGIYFLGMTISILAFGYLSDKYGRKNALLYGYIVFCLASILCMLATSERQLLCFRFLQGIGMGSAFVNFRAIMKDVFKDSKSLAKASLIITSIVSFTPPIAPITGGFIQEYIGWRANFTLHGILSLMTIFLIVKYLHLEPIAKEQISWFAAYRKILKNKVFILNAFCSGLALSVVFIFVTLSPFFFQVKMHFTPIEYSFILLATIIPPAVFILIFKEKVSSVDMNVVMLACASFSLVMGILLALSYFIVGINPLVIVILCALLFSGNGFQYTASYVCAYQDVHGQVGVASAIFGFIQIATTGIFSSLVSSVTLNNQIYLGLLMSIPPLLILLLKILDVKVLKK
jgi:DHA1 family bicyclomycin/chloramphenicol resistance-like MFS transporter